MNKLTLIQYIQTEYEKIPRNKSGDLQIQMDELIELTLITLENTEDKKYYGRIFDDLAASVISLLSVNDQNNFSARVGTHFSKLQNLYVPSPIQNLKKIEVNAAKELKKLKNNISQHKVKATDQFIAHDLVQKKISKEHNETLQFEDPAILWKNASDHHRIIGFIMALILIGVLVVSVTIISNLLMNIPSNVIVSFVSMETGITVEEQGNLNWFEKKSLAIRWAFLFLTLASFLAYVVRSISKVMFSSFHLASDCIERSSLAKFYLSLLNRDVVEVNERAIILQSLFSRSDSGLLGEVGSPSMPGETISKIRGN